MTFLDLIKELSEEFRNRTKNRFVSSFVFSFIAINWDIVLAVIFGDETIYEKISLIKRNIGFSEVIVALIVSLFWIFVLGRFFVFVERKRFEDVELYELELRSARQEERKRHEIRLLEKSLAVELLRKKRRELKLNTGDSNREFQREYMNISPIQAVIRAKTELAHKTIETVSEVRKEISQFLANIVLSSDLATDASIREALVSLLKSARDLSEYFRDDKNFSKGGMNYNSIDGFNSGAAQALLVGFENAHERMLKAFEICNSAAK